MKAREIYSIKSIVHILENVRYHTSVDSHKVVIDTAIDFIKEQEEEINRQQAEIERLKASVDESFNNWLILDERTKQRYAELYEEAIKEFAERLKDKTYPFPCAIGVEHAVTIRIIDDTVKEMDGERKAEIEKQP